MAKRFEDLIVWQLADQLTTRVYRLTTAVTRDFKFCEQLRDAASSTSRNAAEGFGRYRHKEFAQLLTVARGSVFEVVDLLRDGIKRQHWCDADIDETLRLCFRLIVAQTRFIRWLRETPDPPHRHL